MTGLGAKRTFRTCHPRSPPGAKRTSFRAPPGQNTARTNLPLHVPCMCHGESGNGWERTPECGVGFENTKEFVVRSRSRREYMKKPAGAGLSSCSCGIILVAGTGFEPVTFRL